MSREDLLRKLENDEALTPIESALLEAYLEEETGVTTLAAIKELKREDPSFAWRARLNERIAAIPKRRPRATRRLRLGLGAAATALAAMTFVIFSSRPEPRQDSQVNLTSYLYEWHEEASAAVLFQGAGTDLNGFLHRVPDSRRDDIDEILYGSSVIDRL